MDLTIYDIILGPVVTGKAYKLNQQLKQLKFYVHMHSNKILIKHAVEKLFDVKVEDVRTVICKGKNRRVGRRAIQGGNRKKAIITLAQGARLDLFEQAGVSVPAQTAHSSESA